MSSKLMGLIVVVVLVGGLMAIMASVAFANPVAWDLDSTGNGTEANPYVMNHQSSGISESGSFTIASGQTIYIISNAPNSGTTVFPNTGSTDWRLYFYTSGTSIINFDATLGTWSGGTYDANGLRAGGLNDDNNPSWDGISDTGYLNFEQSGTATANAGEWVCIRLTNNDPDSVKIITEDVGANTYLNYYGVEVPAWPTPEIATIVMIILGVLGVGGYIWYRRRKAAPVAA